MSHIKEVIGKIIFLFTGKKKFLSIFYTIRKVAARSRGQEVGTRGGPVARGIDGDSGSRGVDGYPVARDVDGDPGASV